ncbi:unnamed protein product, partial [Owenia fusiformis]
SCLHYTTTKLRKQKTMKVAIFLLLLQLVSAQAVGGKKRVEVTDGDAIHVAEFVVKYMNERDHRSTKLDSLLKVEKQTVAGNKWFLKFDVNDPEKGQLERCVAEVHEQSWLEKMEVLSLDCNAESQNTLKYAQMTGGPRPIDVNDAGVQGALKFAMTTINGRSNSLYRHMLTQTVEATSQVVSGALYTIKFHMGLSECLNDEETQTLDECPVEKDKIEECTVKVWEQAWLKPMYKLQEFYCDSDDKRSKRDVTHMDQEIHESSRNINNRPWLNYPDDDFHQHVKQFHMFKEKFNKQYIDEMEEERRFKIFRVNMKKVRFLQETEQGSGQYGITEFADIDEDEFRKTHLTPKWDLSENHNLAKAEIPNVEAPDAFDWREHNAVTEVKNQGSCGSCWAFSTTGNIEGQWAIKRSKLVSLSEQELVDCDKIDEGCSGGLPSNAYEEIMRLGGLENEKDYPYEGKNDKCEFISGDIRVYINGSVNISKNEGDMAAWLAQNGPISIGINAFAMQFYFGGISHPWSIFCSPGSLDHGVLIVGYGTKNGEPYWIVKNSWGKSWGEEGYYLVYRGSGVCGLNQMCTSSIVK